MAENRIKLYVVPHSHVDIEWYWTLDDNRSMLMELFNASALRILERDKKMTFAQDQSMLWEMILESSSEKDRAVLLERVKAGAVEPVGGTFVQQELQEPCGESLIQQIQIGQKWMEEHLGRRAECAWFIDNFGQINQLPQILLQSGYHSYVFMRDVYDTDCPETFPTEFLYEGLDGSRILTHWLKNTYVLREDESNETGVKIANVAVTSENLKSELQKVFAPFCDPDSIQHKTGAALLLWGDDLYSLRMDTGQVRSKILELAKFAEVDLAADDIVFATPSSFFRALAGKENCLDVYRKDFSLPRYRQDLRGTFVSRIVLKLMNRQAEQALLSLESLCAVCGKALRDAEALWKPVLYNQFHDLMGGSCIDEAYTAAEKRYEKVLSEIRQEKKKLFDVRSSDYSAICVWNPTQFVRNECASVQLPSAVPEMKVVDSDGKTVFSVYDPETRSLTFQVCGIAPFGIKKYRLVPGESTLASVAVRDCVENDYFRLTIDRKTGDLTGIWDKVQLREMLSTVGNVIVALEEDDPDMEGELKLNGVRHRDCGIPADEYAVTESMLSVTVRCVKHMLGFRLEKQIILRKDSPRIEFNTNILDFPGEDLLLMVEFSPAMPRSESVFETPFAIEEGRKGFWCAQKWAALQNETRRFALLNRGTCGYWVENDTISMALLRGYRNYTIYGEYGRARGIPRFSDGGTHTELAAERGDHSFSYSVVCSDCDVAWISSEAMMYNTPLETYFGDIPKTFRSILKTIDDTFIITKLHCGESGTICLRGYHASANETVCTLKFCARLKRIQKVDLQGNCMEEMKPVGNSLNFRARPYEIVTFELEVF